MYKFIFSLVNLSMYKNLSTLETARQGKSIERERFVAESILMNTRLVPVRCNGNI
jgi:hypothetical protein